MDMRWYDIEMRLRFMQTLEMNLNCIWMGWNRVWDFLIKTIDPGFVWKSVNEKETKR